MNPIDIISKQIDQQNLWQHRGTLSRNRFLKAPHTTDLNLYYIVSGGVKICTVDADREHVIRFGYKGSFIAALDSFISEKPSELYIEALKKTEFKAISKTRYLQFIHQSAALTNLWEHLLQQLILQQLEREKDILISSPKERYMRVLKRSPQLFQEIPNKHIASYLRMTPETLSRLKKS